MSFSLACYTSPQSVYYECPINEKLPFDCWLTRYLAPSFFRSSTTALCKPPFCTGIRIWSRLKYSSLSRDCPSFFQCVFRQFIFQQVNDHFTCKRADGNVQSAPVTRHVIEYRSRPAEFFFSNAVMFIINERCRETKIFLTSYDRSSNSHALR